MFFVDHDQAQAWGGGEDGAAGADDHVDFAAGDAVPLPVAFGVVEVAVQHGHLADAGAESLAGLGREADFGNEHDGLLAEGDDLFDGANVHFGFAAACDAVEQEDLMPPLMDGLANEFEGRLLVWVEGVAIAARRGRFVQIEAADAAADGADESFAAELGNGGQGTAGLQGELAGGERVRAVSQEP